MVSCKKNLSLSKYLLIIFPVKALTDRKAYLESSKIFIRAFGTQSDVLDCSYQDDGDSVIKKKFFCDV